MSLVRIVLFNKAIWEKQIRGNLEGWEIHWHLYWPSNCVNCNPTIVSWIYFLHKRVFHSKVRKTQHQNLEFGPKTGEIKNKPVKKYISIQGVKGGGGCQGEFQNTPIFCGKLSFIVFWHPLSFFLSASTAATYIFTAPSCTTTTITLEPCALNAEFQHFIPRSYILYINSLRPSVWRGFWGVGEGEAGETAGDQC